MIKCVAIDDEPIALSIIKEHCRRYGDIDLHCFSSPVAGMECVKSFRPDIVFLDIQLTSHNGVQLARRIPKETCVIFTTAYLEYAFDGFEVDALDFLHKPIFYTRFERAMQKALRILAASGVTKPAAKCITLKVEHKNVVIDTADIICVEAMDNYMKVHRDGKPMVLSQIPMKELLRMLPEGKFARIHRSYIVNVSAVEKYTNRKLFLRNFPNPVPVGRKYIQSGEIEMLIKD